MIFSLFSDVITGPSVPLWLDQMYFLTLALEPTNIWKSNMNVYPTVRIPWFSHTPKAPSNALTHSYFLLTAVSNATTQSTCMLEMLQMSKKSLECVIQFSRRDKDAAVDVKTRDVSCDLKNILHEYTKYYWQCCLCVTVYQRGGMFTHWRDVVVYQMLKSLL